VGRVVLGDACVSTTEVRMVCDLSSCRLSVCANDAESNIEGDWSSERSMSKIEGPTRSSSQVPLGTRQRPLWPGFDIVDGECLPEGMLPSSIGAVVEDSP
jgi:hypothetical protein